MNTKNQNRPMRRLALSPLMLALLAAFPLLPGTASAACVGEDCTGALPGGIAFTVPSPTKPTGRLNVYDLTVPIAPAVGTSGIQLGTTAGFDLTLATGTLAQRIGIVTINAPGIYLTSVGQPPAPGIDAFLGVALPGSPTVQGGVVSVVNRGDISTSTSGPLGAGVPGAHGIYAVSNTAGYPQTMVDALKTFDAAAHGIGFTLGSLTNPKDGSALALDAAVKGVIVNTHVDADGLVVTDSYGAAAGTFTVSANGSVVFDKGSDFDTLLDAGPVTVMLDVVANGTNGSTTNADPGRIFAQVRKKDDGTVEVATWVDFDTWGERSMGGTGGNGLPDLNTYVHALAERAEAAGGAGGGVSVDHRAGAIVTNSAASHGIFAESRGVNGTIGRDGGGFWSFGTRRPGVGGAGKGGGQVDVNVDGSITTTHTASTDQPQDASVGVLAHSVGGAGGAGGAGGTWYFGATGGDGGKGGLVTVTGSGVITTGGRSGIGIYAISEGGDGGNGGPYDVFTGGGGGGVGGGGGEVRVRGRWTITTSGADAHGIWAKSVGGNAGDGGGNGWVAGGGGPGGKASNGGQVTLESGGRVETKGSDAFALFGQSVGGFGGTGGGGFSLFYSTGGGGGSAGNGGAVAVTNLAGGELITGGDGSHALLAQSIGGGGGAGGSTSGLVSRGSSGAYGGDGGQVDAINNGTIRTSGDDARGIFAQSVGGGGGDGGRSGGLSAAGGSGSATSLGGIVNVTNTGSIETSGERANAIYAQSVGGGGGNGGSSGGWFSVGGAGGAGGDARSVTVRNEGTLLKTNKDDASAIFAQSVGGGGGRGGNSASVGVFASLTIGGKGGAAGAGSSVTVDDSAAAVPGQIITGGERAAGIFAQSIGGGGGQGGFAVGAAVGLGAGMTVAIGGDGGGGGNGGLVTVKNSRSIDTAKDDAVGLFAESVGGGGGSGGFSIAASASDSFGLAFSFGGKGAKGGDGNAVDVTNEGGITTVGVRSIGLQAQSVGGGGGSGGFAISAAAGGLGAFSLALGGSATGGGNGELVTVVNDGAISTGGIEAHALLAQSIGGGGGNGGFSIGAAGGGVGAGTVTIGGSGGGGGVGGIVDVTNRGKLTTTENNAVGLFAQSVGGGGGNGGFSVGASGGGVGAGSFNLGGKGATGGSGDTVTVKSYGDISTGGLDSHGLFAQSVGGGGGNGGFALTGSGAGTASGTIAIGGYGDGGGEGKLVDVTQGGKITTVGEGAIGLFAQSVGGGGGNGGFSIAASGAGTASGTLNLGGKGAGGGAGGQVKVDSSGSIDTSGERAHGVLAQSVGGGGGNGGFAVAGAGAGTGAGTLTIGGSAGKGGDAAMVTLTSRGSVDTDGAGAIGLFAQSVGGGGGNGGFAFAGAVGSSLSLSVAVGGGAGAGGFGGTVHLDSSSAVTTQGSGAHAVNAQSIGGGGGSGGMALTGTLGLYTQSGVSASVVVGGAGGTGGFGGDVYVGDTAALGGKLVTTGDGAHGIFAQSVGGGGGTGGSALAMSFVNDVQLPESAKTLTATLKFGGGGGAGNIGGVVTVRNAGVIDTSGDDAHGILAQSVGGGGGSGGSAEGISLSTSGLMPLKDSKATNLGLDLTAGGDGGTGNKGGKVTVVNDGAITTHGVASRGIFAQSIGGGGGSISEGVLGKVGDWIDAGQSVLDGIGVAKTLADAFKEGSASGLIPSSLKLTLGASEGNGANADAVSVTNRADIRTEGLAAHGVFAQSVGAGGGDAKAYAEGRGGSESVSTGVGLQGEFAIGGKGAAAGSGGMVDVDHIGRIDTFGAQAHGIYAQSVGGGGGQAGAAAGGFSGLDSIGLGVAFGRSSGNGGNGQHVGVLSGGAIETRGDRAIGILAQSVGGGGGAAADRSGLAFFGGVGGYGSGGGVDVTHAGTIITAGERAHGIFAQSVGGKSGETDQVWEGRGGAVGVTIRNGGIAANGLDADGILVQSVGLAGAGNLTVTIQNASVQGGSGSGAGVRFLDGAANQLVNGGAIGSLGGTAVIGAGGNETVLNSGLVLGNVDLGTGANRFVNNPGGTFETGALVRLGSGNALSNEGLLSPGGRTHLQATRIEGDLVQRAGGTLLVDVDAYGQGSDHITTTGAAQLAGQVRLSVRNPAPVELRAEIVSAGGGLSAADLTIDATASAVAHYALVRENDKLLLDYRIDFSDVAGLNKNQRRVGAHVNAIQHAGSTAGFAPIADMLFAQPLAAPLAVAYDRLSPEPHGALATGTLLTALRFGDAMLSCRRAEGDARFVREGECSWVNAGATATHQHASDAALGFKRNTQGLAGGVQGELAPDWHLGLAFGIEHGTTDVADLAETTGDFVHGGLVLKRRNGDSTFSASITAGHGRYDSRRVAAQAEGTAIATGTPRIDMVSVQLRAAHAIVQGERYLRPMIDLGFTQVDRKAFDESGAGAANLSVARARDGFVTLRPAVEWGGDWRRDDGMVLRPFVRAGAMLLVSGSAPETQAVLQGAPAGTPPFAVNGRIDRTIPELSLGLDMLNADALSLRLGYTGQFSHLLRAHAASLKLSMPF